MQNPIDTCSIEVAQIQSTNGKTIPSKQTRARSSKCSNLTRLWPLFMGGKHPKGMIIRWKKTCFIKLSWESKCVQKKTCTQIQMQLSIIISFCIFDLINMCTSTHVRTTRIIAEKTFFKVDVQVVL